MSRRNKRYISPDLTKKLQSLIRAVNKNEWALKNYLNINNIYHSDNIMQVIIINSFYIQNGLSVNDSWVAKVKYAHDNFGLFAQYSQNNWKK